MAQWPNVLRLILVLAVLGSVTGHAQAQLAPDERRQMRQEMRQHWQQLPPEERQRFRQERQERREAIHLMPPEDRSRLREELRGRRDSGGESNFGQRGGGRRGVPMNTLLRRWWLPAGSVYGPSIWPMDILRV